MEINMILNMLSYDIWLIISSRKVLNNIMDLYNLSITCRCLRNYFCNNERLITVYSNNLRYVSKITGRLASNVCEELMNEGYKPNIFKYVIIPTLEIHLNRTVLYICKILLPFFYDIKLKLIRCNNNNRSSICDALLRKRFLTFFNNSIDKGEIINTSIDLETFFRYSGNVLIAGDLNIVCYNKEIVPEIDRKIKISGRGCWVNIIYG